MEGSVLVSSSLNLWSTDYKSNERKIIESIVQAKRLHGGKIRVGSACEISSFSSEDHFVEPDTVFHCWQVLASVLEVTHTPPYNDILCVIGMPVCFRGAVYNSAVLVYDGKVIAVRPKTVLCNDLLVREKRWFTAWRAGYEVFDFDLPQVVQEVYGQTSTKIGNVLIKSQDGFIIGIETLDEAKDSVSSSTYQYLMGAHIICCLGSNSFTQLEVDSLDAVKTITDKSGGVYLYSSQVGFDGSRCCFEGGSMILCNGSIMTSTPAFSMNEVELAVCKLDLTVVDSYRNSLSSRNLQSAQTRSYELITVQGFFLNNVKLSETSKPVPSLQYSKPELVRLVASSYMWDYLRKSGAAGFFVGMQEASVENLSVLAILDQMTRRVMQHFGDAKGYNRKILEQDLVKLVGKVPDSAEELMGHLAYAGLFFNESDQDKVLNVRKTVESLNARFIEGSIDSIVSTYMNTFIECTGLQVNEEAASKVTNSLQSRISMVLSYISGQLLTMAYGKKGFLIVASSTSLEQNLTGSHVKYGLSSGDINPIGCIFHNDLKQFLSHYYSHNSSILSLLHDSPSPSISTPKLTLSTAELEFLCKTRKLYKSGPLRALIACLEEWSCPPLETCSKVKLFFTTYGQNRHKSTVLTPLMQFSGSGCDDNRFDLRQFLYNTSWTSQFEELDSYIASL